jgi:hypothetical protein
LLVNEEKIGIIDQKILSYSPPVKEKFAFGNGLRFQAQIEDLCLKCGIPKENRKNNISGSQWRPVEYSVPLSKLRILPTLLNKWFAYHSFLSPRKLKGKADETLFPPEA